MAGGHHRVFGALLHHRPLLLSDRPHSHESPEAPRTVAAATEGPANDSCGGAGLLHLLAAGECLHQHPAAAGHGRPIKEDCDHVVARLSPHGPHR